MGSASHLLVKGFSPGTVSEGDPGHCLWEGNVGLRAGDLSGVRKDFSPAPFFIFLTVAPGNVLWTQQNKYRKLRRNETALWTLLQIEF